VPNLTTTSYAILCLLNLRPWTAYELARQMERSMSWIWPRAVSGVYEEPKRLVAHGLATATSEPAGKRRRTIYTITDTGRRALAEWLSESSKPPRLESEGLIRVSFADAGSKQDALSTLREFQTQAEELHRRIHDQIDSYLAPDHGPFPQRMHIIALDARFFHDYTATLQRWAGWAIEQVEAWPSTTDVDLSFALEPLRELMAAHSADPTTAGVVAVH
jgi:PadR family transcriptional regulator, regulatory protein AphA